MRHGKVLSVAEEIAAGGEVQFQMDIGAVHAGVRNRSDANTYARGAAVTSAGLAAPGLAALDTVIGRTNEAPVAEQLADKLPALDRAPQDGTGLLANHKAGRDDSGKSARGTLKGFPEEFHVISHDSTS
jgi:hypothetical protein